MFLKRVTLVGSLTEKRMFLIVFSEYFLMMRDILYCMCSTMIGRMASQYGAKALPVLSEIMLINLKAAILLSRALVFTDNFYSPSNPFILNVKLVRLSVLLALLDRSAYSILISISSLASLTSVVSMMGMN